MSDAELVAAIDMAALKIMTAPTPQRRRDAYLELQRLARERITRPDPPQGSAA